MPRSKKLSAYPTMFGTALEAAYGKPEGFRIPQESHNAAKRMRMQMYAYLNALERWEDEHNTSYKMRESIMYRQINIRAEGSDLYLIDKAFSPENRALREALEAAGAHIPTNPHLENRLTREQTLDRIAREEAAIAEEEAEPAYHASEDKPKVQSLDDVISAFRQNPKEITND